MVNKTLPASFSFIERIKSVEVRTKLRQVVQSILDLMVGYAPFEFDLATKMQIDRFFKFAEAEGKRLLENKDQPTTWLLTYGEVVQLRLLMLRSKRIITHVIPSPTDSTEFIDRIASLSNTFTTYRITCSTETDSADDSELVKILDDLTGLGVQVIPDGSREYLELAHDVLAFDDEVAERIKRGGTDDDTNAVSSKLLAMRYRLSSYLLLHGAHRQ